MAYQEAILGLGLKPRPNVGFKLGNRTLFCKMKWCSVVTSLSSLKVDLKVVLFNVQRTRSQRSTILSQRTDLLTDIQHNFAQIYTQNLADK